jgi:hypothetical protein
MLPTDPNTNPRGVEPIFTDEVIKRFWAKIEILGPDEYWFWIPASAAVVAE